MRIHLAAACATISVLAIMGCGSYSAPEDGGDAPTAPDSTPDSTPAPPPPGYLVR